MDRLRSCLIAHREALADFVATARELAPARHQLPRAPGKWTPLQEIAHLVQTYSEFAAVLTGQPEFPLMVPAERAAQYHESVLPRILAGSWFPSGAAAPERVQPPTSPGTLEPLAARLCLAEDRFEVAVLAAYHADPSRRVVHPYFGFLTLPDLLLLLAGHARHHAAFLRAAGEATGS